MPVPKRYFHCSQEIIADPEMWEFTDTFGDRSIRTWLQILIYLDRSANQWRLAGDWLAVLSRTVRQSSANLRRQIGWLVEKRWLVVGEQAADGSPLVYKSPNWLKYNRTQEHKRSGAIPDKGAVSDPLLPFPSPTPSLSVPTPKIKKKKELNTCSEPTVAAQVWSRYAEAYQARYKTAPVRNAKVNSQLSQLVSRIGGEAAPEVAAFYVWHNDQFYIRNTHSVDFLLRNAEALHTQWKTGQAVTSSQARRMDQTQGRVNVFQEIINERKGEVLDVEAS